jgi:hypothetical protein
MNQPTLAKKGKKKKGGGATTPPSAGGSQRSWKWLGTTFKVIIGLAFVFVLIPYLWMHMRPERTPDKYREVQFRHSEVKTPPEVKADKPADLIVSLTEVGFKFRYYSDHGGMRVAAHDLRGESTMTWIQSGQIAPPVWPLRVLKGITRDKLKHFLSHNEPWQGEIRAEFDTPEGKVEFSLNPS